MQELFNALVQLSNELKELKALVQSLKNNRPELLKGTWIDGQDVSVALNVSQRTLQTLRTSGLLPFSRFNGKCYYKHADLEALLESNYTRNRQSKRYD